jgi:hypothetical protein
MLEIRRYVTLQIYFTILGQFLAIVLLLEVLLESRTLIRGQSHERRSSSASAHIA